MFEFDMLLKGAFRPVESFAVGYLAFEFFLNFFRRSSRSFYFALVFVLGFVLALFIAIVFGFVLNKIRVT